MKHPKFFETTPAISRRMAKVHLKKGKAETMLAKALWHKGFRYRLNFKALPGSPDIVLTKQKIAIFIDGEFWHGFQWEDRKGRLKSNRDYWITKIEENINRDHRNNNELKQMGWSVLRFWEKEVLKNLEECLETVLAIIKSEAAI